MSTDLPPVGQRSLRTVTWPRFINSPDAALLERLYVPAIGRARFYDRACAYFTSGVLAAAARGFGGLIESLIALGEAAPKPAVRLLVNEQLDKRDLDALLARGDYSRLEKLLLGRLTSPRDAITQNRLQMLGWLVKQGLLEVKVGYMRHTLGINHAKFGVVTDAQGDAIAFMGSGNETEAALVENYERLTIATSWQDADFVNAQRAEFERLWSDADAHVGVVSLPDAVRLKLIQFAPARGRVPRPGPIFDRPGAEAAMLWHFLAAAPYLADGDLAMDATAPVTLWEHQKKVVADTAAAFPAGRLLCDEVGMGKTIEAILVLRRLLAGRGVKRVLLLVPAGLLYQWQGELREKGGLLVPIWDRGFLIQPGGGKASVEADVAFAETPLLLLSREWARIPRNRDLLLSAPAWDLLLLDEAHHARRKAQVESEFNSANLLLDLLRQFQLRRRTRGILLLSATPMQTQPWEPWDLLQVLGVGGDWLVDFGDIRTYYAAIATLRGGEIDSAMAEQVNRLVEADDGFPALPLPVLDLPWAEPGAMRAAADALRAGSPLARHMHRNTRETLRSYYRNGLLTSEPPRRNVQDVVFDYESAAERDAYDTVADYINERFEQLEKERGGKGFVMTVYQRRASSSPHALRRSLGRRLDLCDRVINQHARADFLSIEEEELDMRDLGDADLDESIDPAAPRTTKEAKKEAGDIGELLAQLDALGRQDSKLKQFFDLLRTITADGRAVLVFTEYTDTMDYLRDELQPTYGNTLACYSGGGGQIWSGGGWEHVTKAEITDRLTAGKIKVLVCTDAASEGLNLQAASALVNYDLPWNPSKVEQRIGRIDRIGQKEKLLPIRNLFLRDSVDEAVYSALRRRCALFEHFVGRMQPVLAVARDALRNNLTRAKLNATLDDIEHKAQALQADSVADAAYFSSPADFTPTPPAPVTAADVDAAFNRLAGRHGKVTAGKQASGWKLTLPGRSRRVATRQKELEANADLVPFTLLDAAAVADQLPLSSRMPLVVGVAEDGPFRAVEVRWVAADGHQTVTSASHLRNLLAAWDGGYPSAALLVAANAEAATAAQTRLAVLKQRAAREEKAGLERQRAAARSRLLHALARHLRLQGKDLGGIFQKQLQAEKDPEGIYHRAYRCLGSRPTFTRLHLDDADSFVAALSDDERRKRVLLPSELRAALDDPRWLAAN